jgi:hypothetical protein
MSDNIESLSLDLERDLFNKYGPLIGGTELASALGFSSLAAFRQSLTRNQVTVHVFTIEKRKGKFALVKDVARWLACQRYRG